MRRFFAAVVGILMVVVLVATLFLSPGLRHTHQGGDEVHSHQATHSHGAAHHHTHGHGHGHEHTHGTHGHSPSHSHQHDSQVTAAQTHVHISFLWFEITLPDFSGGDEQPLAASAASAGGADATADSSRVVSITSPFTMARLIQLVLLIPAPLPERTTVPISDVVGWLNPSSQLKAGRLPDAPLLPPPEFA
ncbi:MAG: hypothetical protein RIK87_02660 [Fuerstiella sp.]